MQLTDLRQTIHNVGIVQQKQKVIGPLKFIWCNHIALQHFNVLPAVDAEDIVAVQKFGAALPLLNHHTVSEGDLNEGLVYVFRIENKGFGAHFQSPILLFDVVRFRGRVGRYENRTEVLEINFTGIQLQQGKTKLFKFNI